LFEAGSLRKIGWPEVPARQPERLAASDPGEIRVREELEDGCGSVIILGSLDSWCEDADRGRRSGVANHFNMTGEDESAMIGR
jgi:hypothetical protein